MKGIWKEQKENVEKKEVKIENEPGKEMLFIMTLFSHSLFVVSKRKILAVVVVSSLFSCPVID